MKPAAGQLGRREFVLSLASLSAACATAGGLPGPFKKAPRCVPAGCAMVDVHTHLFNASDLPIEGFITHVAPVPEVVTKRVAARLHAELNALAPSGAEELALILALPAGPIRATKAKPLAVQVGKLVAAMVPRIPYVLGDPKALVARLQSTLAMLVKPRYAIAAELVSAYPSVGLFTPALVDYGYWSSDGSETPLHDQLRVQEALAQLSMKGRFERAEARIHPLAPFNPLREVREVIQSLSAAQKYEPLGTGFARTGRYQCEPLPPADGLRAGRGALAPLRDALENHGFVGAKVYPPSGFKPLANESWAGVELGNQLDTALDAFYAYCEAEHVPVMTHANNSNGFHLGYGMLAEPAHWELVLARYPNLRLNIGHFGHLEGVDEARGIEACEAWLRQAAVLMTRYPHVYADTGNSQLAVDSAYAKRFVRTMRLLFERYPVAQRRLMYGTDFWMNKLGANSALFADAFHQTFNEEFPAGAAGMLRDNALRFLGFLDDAGKKPGDNRNRQRLLRYYGAQGAQPPSWL